MATRNVPKVRQSTQVVDRKLRTRGRQPILISSHPEADPELPTAASDPAAPEDFRRGPDAERAKPIVSINGSDVEEPDESECDAA